MKRIYHHNIYNCANIFTLVLFTIYKKNDTIYEINKKGFLFIVSINSL